MESFLFRQKPEHTFIIAEIGTGHGGSLKRAKELVRAAVDSGADCVKFQWVYADEILHPDTGFVRLPGGNIRLYDRFKELEVSPDFFAAVKEYTEQQKVLFLCSPFGLKSLNELIKLKPFAIKIASPELNHFPLLQAVSMMEGADGLPVPIILSSGVSTLADIEKALAATRTTPRRALLHCITSYPAPEEEYNLKILSAISQIFDIPAGVSDHSLDPVLIPVLSVACGGRIIEKHFTLSRTAGGLDDPIALSPADFQKMTRAVREAEVIEHTEIIEQTTGKYGQERVRAVLGTGKKELAPSEKENYPRTNRSIHFIKNLPAQAVIKETDIAVLRTEKILTPGISPEFLDQVTGSVLAKRAVSGEGVSWEHIIRK